MKTIFTLLISIVFCSMSFAQITINVPPNPNPNIGEWENNNETIIVTVNNTGKETMVKFDVTLLLNGETKAFSKPADMPLVSLDRGVNIFYAEDIVPYNAMELVGANQNNIARTGQLPAGTYQICIKILDENNAPSPFFHEKCAPFLISQLQPPTLIMPLADESIPFGKRPTFRWTPIVPQPKGLTVVYKLQIFEILPGQNTIQAFRSNQPIIEEEVNGQTQYWPIEWDLPNDEGSKRYIWSVQAMDDNGNSVGENEGRAEPKIFHYGGPNTKAMADGDGWSQCAAYSCKAKGVNVAISVPSDAIETGSTAYKITATSFNYISYGTASQAIAKFGSTAAPEVNNLGYFGADSWYCDKDGFPIKNQNVYQFTENNPYNYNGNTNELFASGACLNYLNYNSLATHYNSYNNTYLDIPSTCKPECIDGGGGVDGSGPGGSNPVDASGQELDDVTLDPTNNDGGVTPSGGGIDINAKPASGNPLEISTKPNDGNGPNTKAMDDGDGWKQCASFNCQSKGARVAIYVPNDAAETGSISYKVVAEPFSLTTFGTAAQAIAKYGTLAAPEVANLGYFGPNSPYCDKDGFAIKNQNVYQMSENNPYNYAGNTNELFASGVCFDYTDYNSLASHYNSYNGTYLNVPSTCGDKCNTGGGVDGGGPGSGSNPTNAAGEEIDDITLDPINSDGGVMPGGGIDLDNIPGLNNLPETWKPNTNMIFVESAAQGFRKTTLTENSAINTSKESFCICPDGSVNPDDSKNCSGCKNLNKNTKQDVTKVNVCKCQNADKNYTVLSTKPKATACANFNKWLNNGNTIQAGRKCCRGHVTVLKAAAPDANGNLPEGNYRYIDGTLHEIEIEWEGDLKPEVGEDYYLFKNGDILLTEKNKQGEMGSRIRDCECIRKVIIQCDVPCAECCKWSTKLPCCRGHVTVLKAAAPNPNGGLEAGTYMTIDGIVQKVNLRWENATEPKVGEVFYVFKNGDISTNETNELGEVGDGKKKCECHDGLYMYCDKGTPCSNCCFPVINGKRIKKL